MPIKEAVDVFTPSLPVDMRVNPLLSAYDWRRMREACEEDPGEFHGDIAARTIHWFHPDKKAWMQKDNMNHWVGLNDRGDQVRETAWTPWETALDTSKAPLYRWFLGGLTNAAFNEVDRHVLDGHGAETAFWYEGDRWDGSANGGKGGPVHAETLTRRELLKRSVLAAIALQQLGLKQGDRMALNMPNTLDQIIWTQAAKRLGVIYTAVFGGFSDKTLADRIINAGAKVVITTDGASRNAEHVPFKAIYTDRALQDFLAFDAARRVVAETLKKHLNDGVVQRVLDRMEETMGQEITVTPADIMRVVGQHLAVDGEHDETALVRLRVELAQALADAPRQVESVVVVKHVGLQDVPWQPGRDLWAHELLARAGEELASRMGRSLDEVNAFDDRQFALALGRACPCVPVDANYPLFIIYTSGSTGKPKGVVHCHGGYLAGIAHTMRISFDAVPGRDRIYVVADPGWITGQSYLISAALVTRIPGVVTEGAPIFPHAGRFASIIERYGITIFKAGVTFLKTVMSKPQHRADVERYDLKSLRVATFCAEPTSPAVQRFGMELMTPQYINSYWATEHGGIVWTHPYGNRDLRLRANTHSYPLPWVFGDVWVPEGEPDEQGRYRYRQAEVEERGEVVITQPYPYLARTIWGDPEGVLDEDWEGDLERFRQIYFSRFRDDKDEPVLAYLQGDFAVRYDDDSFTFHGRSDDVINVSGHRMGTEEIEGAILKDKMLRPDSAVGNCVVVGAPHSEKGQTPVVFVMTAEGKPLSADLVERLRELVREEKGAVAVPAAGDFISVAAFPETRSGKYMRRMLKAMILGEELGDTTTLRNPECIEPIRRQVAHWQAGQALTESQRLFEDSRFVRIRYYPLKDGVNLAALIIRHPPVNALSDRVLDELQGAVDTLKARDDVKAIVVGSEKPGAFVAGADIRELLEDVDEVAEVAAFAAKAHGVFGELEAFKAPVIAAVGGAALGGGCELAMACHVRISDRNATWGQPEINLWIPPGYGGTQRLPRLLMAAADKGETGLSRALSLLLSGRAIDADTAYTWGLVDRLVGERGDAMTEALAWARAHVLGEDESLGELVSARREAVEAWRKGGDKLPDSLLGEGHVKHCLAQADKAGRKAVAERIVTLVRGGLADGIEAGIKNEIEAFAELVMDEKAGRKGLRLFMDKSSPALPLHPVGPPPKDAWPQLEKAGELLPVGAAFAPGAQPLPRWQYGWSIQKDPVTAMPDHGEPSKAERLAVLPVPEPGGEDVLLYVLASELNFNDVWALTGIPISVFELHDQDIHVTGSGALGMIVDMGERVREEGRLRIGQLVSVYSGQSDLLDPAAGIDPMATRFVNQGYETPDGSHAQFLKAQGPQCFPLLPGLSMEQLAGYILAAGTVHRCLFHALDVQSGGRVLVEGASSGTGAWAVAMARSAGLNVTGMVSNDERAKRLESSGVRALHRGKDSVKAAFKPVPDDPVQWAAWEKEGEAMLRKLRLANDDELMDYVVSHGGENTFPRLFQALAEGGSIAFYGASSGYRMTFVGKAGAASPAHMLRRARLQAGQAVLCYYGMDGEAWDHDGLAAIEAARYRGARVVVITREFKQRDILESLGFGESLRGVVVLDELVRDEDFVWPETFPSLPDPTDREAYQAVVRGYQEHTFKPVAAAVGRLVRSADNPRGLVDVAMERAGQDTLGLSTMLVKPNTGVVVYFEDMRGRRYSFYAPQVWNRQRRILMPSASILGTHLCNGADVQAVQRLILHGGLSVPDTALIPWDKGPEAHQAIWENRLPEMTEGRVKAVLNHALPAEGIVSEDELLMLWAE